MADVTTEPKGWVPWVVGLIVSAIIGPVAAPFIFRWIDAGVGGQGPSGFWAPTLGVIVALLIAALVCISVIRRTWRRVIWLRFGAWFMHTRPVVMRAAVRDRIESDRYTEGYNERSAEVQAERDSVLVKDPAWRIDPKDDVFGDNAMYWLVNIGMEGWDVRVTASEEYFLIAGDAFFAGHWQASRGGSSSAQWFRGTATEKGKSDGVIFTVTWRDRSGDERSSEVRMLAEEFAMPVETTGAAYKRGYDQGVEYMQEKMDEKEAAASADLPPLPLPEPRWSVYEDTTADDTDFVLRNSVDRSVALEVRIEPDSDMTLVTGGHWSDVSGEKIVSFSGVRSDRGRWWGVGITVTWYDERHEQHLRNITLPGHPDEAPDADPDVF